MEIEENKRRKKNGFLSSRKTLFKSGILCGFLLLVALYLFSSSSRVKAVKISGAHYLSDAYIKEISSIDTDDIYYLQIPFVKEWKLKNDPMIEDADVTLGDNGVISITITEKKVIGYRYDDTAVILLGDNTTAELKSEYLDIIASVPLITGFVDEEQTRLLTKAFAEVDQSIIESIAEISQYTLSYDSEAMKIHMRNGGYFIGDYQNLDKLNQYYLIYSKMSDKSKCISADDNSSVAYTYTCPWDEAESTNEYWTDSEGNIITNEYGDKVVKHYYTDDEGNPALDASGNQIPIPIDSYGNETIDPDFSSNYASGYYAGGTLNKTDAGGEAVQSEETNTETVEESGE